MASAHDGTDPEAATARLAFVQRYQRAAYRYLLGALRDVDAADDLFQEMVLRFVRGDFRGADPDKGRFRNYLKTTLSHLIVDHHKRQRKRPVPLELSVPQADDAAPCHEADVAFRNSWRDELLDRAWEKLEQDERDGGPPFYRVLRCRAENADSSSSDIARLLSVEQGSASTLTPENVRKLIQRARQRFSSHLLDEVARSLQRPNDDDIERELIELDLLRFCRGALRRRDS